MTLYRFSFRLSSNAALPATYLGVEVPVELRSVLQMIVRGYDDDQLLPVHACTKRHEQGPHACAERSAERGPGGRLSSPILPVRDRLQHRGQYPRQVHALRGQQRARGANLFPQPTGTRLTAAPKPVPQAGACRPMRPGALAARHVEGRGGDRGGRLSECDRGVTPLGACRLTRPDA